MGLPEVAVLVTPSSALALEPAKVLLPEKVLLAPRPAKTPFNVDSSAEVLRLSATLPLVPLPESGEVVVMPVMVPDPVPGKVCPEAKVMAFENVSLPVKVLFAERETVPGKVCPEAKEIALEKVLDPVKVFVPLNETVPGKLCPDAKVIGLVKVLAAAS